MLETVINQSFTSVIHAPSGSGTGADLQVYAGTSYLASLPVTLTPLSSNASLYSVTFTPTQTGEYTVYCFGQVALKVNVVSKSLYATVKNLEDAALGSWQWNKVTGVLTLLRVDGTQLATFNINDTLTEGSRERTA